MPGLTDAGVPSRAICSLDYRSAASQAGRKVQSVCQAAAAGKSTFGQANRPFGCERTSGDQLYELNAGPAYPLFRITIAICSLGTIRRTRSRLSEGVLRASTTTINLLSMAIPASKSALCSAEWKSTTMQLYFGW
jgi:hypothetical protein